jgi:bacterial/archaeal transporter family-2 protein
MSTTGSRTALFAVALGTGCLPTILLSLNSEIALYAGPLLGSWIVHGTGTLAAIVLLLLLSVAQRPRSSRPEGKPPLWAFVGGCTGAFNVMLSATAVNAGLSLSGTQAVALSGQMLFGIAADRWGFLGLPRRPVTIVDLVPAAMIVAGCLIIVLFGSSILP